MAVKTVSNTGGNWASASTWSPSGVPSTTADNVVFTSTSGPLIVNAPATIEAISFQNYQNTLTLNAPLTVTGNMVFGTSSFTMSFTQSTESLGLSFYSWDAELGRIRLTDNATIITHGKTWSTPWEFGGTTETHTIVGDLILSENAYFAQTGTLTINRGAGPTFGAIVTKKNTSFISTEAAPQPITTGTATFSMSPGPGGGTWSSQGHVVRNNLLLNPDPGSNLYIYQSVFYGGGILSTTSSSVSLITTTSSNAILHIETSCSVNTGELRWYDVVFDSTLTLTFLRDFYINGILTITQPITMTSSQISPNNFAGKFKFEGPDGITQRGDLEIYAAYTQENPPTGTALTFTNNLGDLSVRNLSIGGGAFNTTVNRNIINVYANMTIMAPWYYLSSFPITSGTTEIHMRGTGTLTNTWTDLMLITPGAVGSIIRNNILINTTGTITIGTIIYQTGSFSHVSGSVVGGNLYIDNSTARITFPGHTWSSTIYGYWVEPTFGYFTNRPGFIHRQLTYNWNTNLLSFNSNVGVQITSNTFSTFTRSLSVGCTTSGTSSIILGEPGITSSENVTLSGRRRISNPLTINTTGKVQIGNTNQFVYSGERSIPTSGLFRHLNGVSSFNRNQYFELTNDVGGTHSIHFYHNTLTFSNFIITATSAGTGLDVYIGSTISADHIELSPTEGGSFIGGIWTPSPAFTSYINIHATGSSLTASTIEFSYPGTVDIFDSTKSDEGFYCRNARFTAPVVTTNTLDSLPISAVGAAGSTIDHPTLYISNGTYSVETNCNISGNAELRGNSILYTKPGNFGLIGSGLTIYNDLTVRGDMRFRNSSVSYTLSDSVSWGTSSLNFYDDNSFRYLSPLYTIPVVNWFGTVFSNTTRSRLLTYGTFSVRYLNLRPSNWTTNLVIGEGQVNNHILIGTFSLGTQSGYTLNIAKYRDIANVNEYTTDVYVSDHIGVTNSRATILSPIIISSTWSFGSTPSNRNSNLIIDYNATQDLQFVNARRINSASGSTVWTYKGTLTQSTNWNNLPTQPRTISSSSAT